MDLNNILLWLVIPVLVTNLYWLVRYSGSKVEIALRAVILAVIGAILVIKPAYAGYVGTFLLVLMVLPSLWVRKIQRLAFQQKFAAAERTANFVRWLLPTQQLRTAPTLLRAMDAGSRGDFATATALLAPYQAATTPLARDMTARLFRIQGDWAGFLNWMEQAQLAPARSPEIATMAFRAYGEMGALNEMTVAYLRWQRMLTSSPAVKAITRMQLLAFTGRVNSTRNLLEGRLALFPQPIKDYWLATAEMTAGNTETAINILQNIRTDDQMLILAVKKRLEQPLPVAREVLALESIAVVDDLERTIADEIRFGSATRWTRAYVTYGLIAANCAAFIAEVLRGGSENEDNLYHMGALVPSEVLTGEWWRVAAALFLHLGFLHLFMNMVALYYLGPFAEAALGRIKYLIGYLGAGLGSMLCIVLATKLGWMQEEMVVGASGAIMGIVGMTGGIMLLARKSPVAARRLKSVVFIIVLQAVFDQATPNISAVGHAAGATIGFLLGLVLAKKNSD